MLATIDMTAAGSRQAYRILLELTLCQNLGGLSVEAGHVVQRLVKTSEVCVSPDYDRSVANSS